MKTVAKILVLLLCLGLLVLPAAAVSGADTAQTTAVVEEDGSCYVTMRLQLRLEREERLTLPLPLGAKEVRLNGRLRTPSQQGAQWVLQLPKFSAGVHTLEISFRLPCAVTEKSGGLWVEVPLLTGFAYPVDNFSCTITLPTAPVESPTFVSGYYGESIADQLQVQVQGNVIRCQNIAPLKDRETLLLQCRGDQQMLPRYSGRQSLLGLWESAAAILLAVGGVYYLVALLPSLPRRIRSYSPPDGLAAGDLGTCLTGCGMDLSMMVFSWAQLGYLSIETDGRTKVRLLRRMEMGSERSAFENKCFQVLFSRGDRVDGTGLHYALLCRKMAGKSPLLRQIYRSRSGNPRIVCVLAIAAGACCGVALSLGVYTAGVGTFFLGLALAVLCALLSAGIQSGSRCLPLGNKLPLWIGLLCALLWIGLGHWMGNLILAALMVLMQGITGLAAALGGRRSEIGRQYLAQIRGLRHHLTRVSVFEMQQCLERNPGYFFELMPYALALGVEKPFARRFGKTVIPECSFLSAPVRGELTAYQWAALLRHVADLLNRRQRKLKLEQIFPQPENRKEK